MKYRFPSAVLTALLAVLLASSAWGQPGKAEVDLHARLKEAEASLRLLDAANKTGAKVASFCANCHGEGGNSPNPDTPNLAGQNTSYLLEQLRQFAEGKRRNIFMEGMIKALSPEEKVGVVLHYSHQEVAFKPTANTALAAKGQEYYNKICFRCHGDQGRGNDKIARIAGQQPGYLAVTLKRYRDGSAVRTDPLMAANTKAMSDADIAAVVAYVSSMK
ncbi:MAG: c-type cytochrome [Burkholderiales bacterium]|nr:c-type cytochrome [Burkholderiales bacterium]